MPWVGKWVKSKLAHLLEDFNSADIELDIRQGTLGLKSVRVASDALQNVSDKLCCAAPLVLTALTVGKVHVKLDWKSFATKISLEKVELKLETQPASDWDIKKATENFQAAKIDALRMHSALLQHRHVEGAGYFHSLAAAILDELEFCVNGLMCQVSDSVSLLIDGMIQPFVLGAGVRKVELAAGSNRVKRDAVLRRVLLEHPCVFLDVGKQSSEDPEYRIAAAHDWILKPFEDICFELGLLQCRRPLRSGSLGARDEEGFTLIQPSDFAHLAYIMHDPEVRGRVSVGRDLPLPASVALFAVPPLRLELSPRKLEALMAFAAFVGLGYSVVLEGVRAKYERKASAGELEKYAHDWLMKTFHKDAVCLLADKAINDFESHHAVAVLMRAREDALSATLSSGNCKQERMGHVQAAVTTMRHLIFGRKVEVSNESSEDSWQETAALIRETLMMRDPGWHQSWLELCNSDGAALVFGGRCMKMQVDVALLLNNGMPAMLSLGMDEIVFSAARQHDGVENVQVALFEFRVEDNYSAKKLERLSSYSQACRASRTPLSRTLVTTRSVAAEEFDDDDLDRFAHPHGGTSHESKHLANPQRSELYFHVGRRTRRRLPEDPDGWLRLRSFGAMYICLPMHQLLVLFSGLLPATTRKGLRTWLAGVPWRSQAKESIVALADSIFDEGCRIDFLVENWQLDIDMQPVHVLMPLPRAFGPMSTIFADTASLSLDPDFSTFGDVFDLCLGNLSASSRIASRPACERSEVGAVGEARENGILYTEYSTDIQGISCHRHAWSGSILPDEVVGRVIMPTTSSKFSLLVAQREQADGRGYRKLTMEYHMEACETHWQEADIESIAELLDEVFWTLSEILFEAATKAKIYTVRHLQELALRSASEAKAKTLRSKLMPVQDADKLWSVIFHIDRIRTFLHLEHDESGSEVSQKNDLALLVDNMQLSVHLSRDGSMRIEQKVPRVELKGLQHKLYFGGRIRGSGDQMKDRRRAGDRNIEEDHLSVAVHFFAPAQLGGEWSCAVSYRTIEPKFMIWWAALYPPLEAIIMCFKRALIDRHKGSPKITQQVTLIRRRLQVATRKAKLLARSFLSILPDHLSLFVTIQRGHLLLPCDAAEGDEMKQSRGAPQVLSTRGTVVIELQDLRIPKNEAMQITAFPEFMLHASFIGLAADFILPPLGGDAASRYLHDIWSWAVTARTSSPKVLLLSPYRTTFTCKAGRNGDMKVRLSKEPMTLHVYPATRFMFMDLAKSGAAQFAFHQSWRLFEKFCGNSHYPPSNSSPKHQETNEQGDDSPKDQEEERPSASFIGLVPSASFIGRCPSASFTALEDRLASGTIENDEWSCQHSLVSVQEHAHIVDIDEEYESEMPRLSFLSVGQTISEVPRSLSSFSEVSSTMNSQLNSFQSTEGSVSFHRLADLDLFCIPLRYNMDLIISIEALQIQLSELPGAAQQLHADVKLESLFLHTSLNYDMDIGFTWRSKYESLIQANGLDALSLQTEPIIEPTCIKWNLAYQSSKTVTGSACITWLNLNLPLGLFYSVRLWVQSDSLQRMKREYDASGDGGDMSSWFMAVGSNTSDNSRARSLTLHDFMPGTPTGAIIMPDVQCEIINKLGQPIAVKQLDGIVSGKYCYIAQNSTHRPKVQHQDDASTTVPTVPKVAIRTVLAGEVMEIVFQSELQVPQFEVIRIEHVRGIAFSLIFRAIPDSSGRGCALVIAPSVMVRNTTSLHVNWALPEPEDIDHHAALVPELTSRNAMSASESVNDDFSRPPLVRKSSSSSRNSKVRSEPTPVRWSNRSQPTPSRKSAVTFDESILEEVDVKRSKSQRLGPGQHIPLTLPWITAASDASQVETLTMSVAGSSESGQVLPADTLLNLGRFDLDKAHYADQQQNLDGSLITLIDETGEPVHLCCTVTVGLQGEHAVCLEIVVSSIFLLVNHLPLPVKVIASTKEGERRNPKKVLAGGTIKEYLAADFLSIEIETPYGTSLALASKLKCKRPFKESVESTWKTQSLQSLSRGRTATLGTGTNTHHADLATELDRVVTIRMLTSSAFDLDTSLQGDSMDAWMQTLSWVHPKGWQTYRRAITIWTPCVIENYSTCDLWFKAAGARKLKTLSDELAVPMASWRILPAHLAAIGKMRMGTKSGVTRTGSDTLRWQSRVKNTKKTQHLQCGFEDNDGETSHVYFGVRVDRGPMPFAKTTIIQIFDNLTIRNHTDQRIRCEIPASSKLPLKFLSRSKYLVRSARNKAKVVKLEPQSEMRLDTDAPVFAFCATEAKKMKLDGIEASRGSESSESEAEAMDWMHMDSSPSKGTTHTNALADCTVVRLGTEQVRNKITMANITMGNITMGNVGNGLASSIDAIATIGAQATSGANQLCQNLLTFGKSSFLAAAFVDITRPTSFQIRARYGVEQGIDQFENFRVSVQRSYQGSTTIVNFDTAEPRFYVHNSTITYVEIWQQNVPNVREILPSGAKIPFVWYDPESPPDLVARPISFSNSAITQQKSDRMDSAIQQVLRFTKVAGKRDRTATTQTHDVRYAQDRKVKIVREFDSKTGHEILKILAPHDYKMWILKNRKKKTGYRDLGNERTQPSSDVDVSIHSQDTAEKYKMRPGIEFVLEGLGVSLVDTSQVQVLYAACDNLIVTVAASTFGSRESIPLELSLTSSGMSLKERLQILLAFLPAIDFSILLQNFQIDSHIPGSFFPCVVRPLHAQSQLWRSLQFYSPNPPKNAKLKEPVMRFDVVGCQLLTRTSGSNVVVVNSCVGGISEFVVNIDEAMIVGICAYYCRIAIYFNLPPFKAEDSNEEDSPRKEARFQEEMSLKTGTHNSLGSPIGRHRERAADQLFLISAEDIIEIKETTSYLSLRLMESANTYVEDLQNDEHVGVLLGMLTPLYAAALFQPAMISTHARALTLPHPYMSFTEFLKLIDNHFIAPMQTRIGLLLFISFDFIGNPRQLLLGILAGFRELIRQPLRRGPCTGLAFGILICVSSILGSVFDSISRIINSAVKRIDWVQRFIHRRFDVREARRGADVFALSRTPVNWSDGLYRGSSLALLQSRRIFLTMRQLLKWYRRKSIERPERVFGYTILVILAWVATFAFGMIEVVLLFLYNVLQGCVSSLYRRSAEAVCDLAPLQLMALELPMAVRPQQPATAEQDGSSRGITGAPFAYLPALVQAQLQPEAGLALPWHWHRCKDDEGEEVDDKVISAIWCGKSSSGDSETLVLTETGLTVSLLEIKDWGHLTASSRPKRPKAAYKWLWHIQRSDIRHVGIKKRQSSDKDWVLVISYRPMSVGKFGSQTLPQKLVHFSSKLNAFRALEVFSRTISPNPDSRNENSWIHGQSIRSAQSVLTISTLGDAVPQPKTIDLDQISEVIECERVADEETYV